jgi:hypothetical protein
VSGSPFNGRRSPWDTDAARAELAEREQREALAVQYVECRACGESTIDHGGERPLCDVCDRRMTFGTVLDHAVDFFFGSPKKGGRRRK